MLVFAGSVGRGLAGDLSGETMTSEIQHHLEYEFTPPQVGAPPTISIARVLALGYVAACVFGLVLMGVIMALQV
jgi:hypothetical protein